MPLSLHSKIANDPYRTKYNRDGTVTIWSTHRQQWERVDVNENSDQTYSTLSPEERSKIERMVDRIKANA